MHLLKALVFRRQVLQWLIPLISLWIAIIVGLALSGSVIAQPEPERSQRILPVDHFGKSLHLAAYRPPENDFSQAAQRIPKADQETYELPSGATALFDANLELAAADLISAADAYVPLPPLHLDMECQTPMSLMLHSSFGEGRMLQLAREILARGYKTTTYAEVTQSLRSGECPASNSIIVSLDDFGTDWLRSYFTTMIEAFSERGLRLVVAVNVHGIQDPQAWSYLQELVANGNEVANHTIDHYNLARLDPDEVRKQIKGAHHIICVNLGTCPETLILPFGIIDDRGVVVEASRGYNYVVGIPGGRQFGGMPPYYLGRIGPDNFDQSRTLNELAASFPSHTTALDMYMSLRNTTGRGCSAGPSPSSTMSIALCMPTGQTVLEPDSPLKPAE